MLASSAASSASAHGEVGLQRLELGALGLDARRRLAALIDLDPQRLERGAAVAQPLLAARELGIAPLELLGLGDELGGLLAERELLRA